MSTVTLLRVGTALVRLQRLHAYATGAKPPSKPRLTLNPKQAAARYRTAAVALTTHTLLMSPARRGALAKSLLARTARAGTIAGIEGVLLTSTLEALRVGDPVYAQLHAVWIRFGAPKATDGGASSVLVAVPGTGELYALTPDAITTVLGHLPKSPDPSGFPAIESMLGKLSAVDEASVALCHEVPYTLSLIVVSAAAAARATHRSAQVAKLHARGGGPKPPKLDPGVASGSAQTSTIAGVFVNGVASTSTAGSGTPTVAANGAASAGVSTGADDPFGTAAATSGDTTGVVWVSGGDASSADWSGTGGSTVSQTSTSLNDRDGDWAATTDSSGVASVSLDYTGEDGSSSITWTFANGDTSTLGYDASGKYTGTVSYDASTGQRTAVDAGGNQVPVPGGYSGNGSWTEVGADGSVIATGTTTTDPTTGVKTDTTTYNDGFAKITQTDAQGNTLYTSTTKTDANGVVTTTATTSAGTTKTVTTPDGTSTTTFTDNDGNTYTSTDKDDDDDNDDFDDDDDFFDEGQYVAGDYDDLSRGDTSGSALHLGFSSGDPLDVPTSDGGGTLNWGLVTTGEGPLAGDVTTAAVGATLNAGLLVDPSSDGDPREGSGGGGGFKPPVGGWSAAPPVTSRDETSKALSRAGNGFRVNGVPAISAAGVESLGFVGDLAGFRTAATLAISDINAVLATKKS